MASHKQTKRFATPNTLQYWSIIYHHWQCKAVVSLITATISCLMHLVSLCVMNAAKPMRQVILSSSFHSTLCKKLNASAMFQSIGKLTIIHTLLINTLAMSMRLAMNKLTTVHGAVATLKQTSTMTYIMHPLSIITTAIYLITYSTSMTT